MAVSRSPGSVPVSEAAVRAVLLYGIVKAPPDFDPHPGLGEAVEDLAVKQFVAKQS